MTFNDALNYLNYLAASIQCKLNNERFTGKAPAEGKISSLEQRIKQPKNL